MNYRVVFFGNWGLGLAGLEGLLACPNVEIVKVYTKWDEASDNPFLNLVHDRAQQQGLAVFNSDKNVASLRAFTADILANERIDFLISCCFDRIFKADVLAHPRLPLNVHPSLLPYYRGIKPLENAIVQGEPVVGVTMHELVEALDEGAVLLQMAGITVHGEDTFDELFEQQSKLATTVIRQFFTNPEYYVEHRQAQQHELATTAPRLPFEFEGTATVRELQETYRNYQARQQADTVAG